MLSCLLARSQAYIIFLKDAVSKRPLHLLNTGPEETDELSEGAEISKINLKKDVEVGLVYVESAAAPIGEGSTKEQKLKKTI